MGKRKPEGLIDAIIRIADAFDRLVDLLEDLADALDRDHWGPGGDQN
jgi:hypothetical protein